MKAIFEENISIDSVNDIEDQDFFSFFDFNEHYENSPKLAPRRQIDIMQENKKLMLTIKEVYDL